MRSHPERCQESRNTLLQPMLCAGRNHVILNICSHEKSLSQRCPLVPMTSSHGTPYVQLHLSDIDSYQRLKSLPEMVDEKEMPLAVENLKWQ